LAGISKVPSLENSSFLKAVYESRFSGDELASKEELWKVLVQSFLQAMIPVDATVVDLGAGNCEFINEIRARTRVAVDLNPDTARLANPGVRVLATSSENLQDIADDSVDVVFTSNFFEHLRSKESLLATLAETNRILVPRGVLIVLMPNMRYLPGAYWDYFDHHLPLTHHSLSEALNLAGFRVTRVEPRFLPYTVKNSKVRARAWMLRAYLKFKPAWRLLGKQMLVVAAKS
jgi:SAM-dependent methyltransferase